MTPETCLSGSIRSGYGFKTYTQMKYAAATILLVAYMRKMGQDSHKDYQEHSGKCTVAEFETGAGPADCLWAEKCYVIELKPNNSRAVGKGKSQASNYAKALDDNEQFHQPCQKNL